MIETVRLRLNAASREQMEAFIANVASRRVLEKAGFVRTGEVGEEGPRYVRKSRNININQKVSNYMVDFLLKDLI